ncbi:MAG: class I SAM-dependent methyltransferase [Candidatus Binataceae bacterium]
MFEHSTSAADSPDDDCVSEASEVVERVAQATSIKHAAYDCPWLRHGYVMQFREVEQAVLDEIPRCGHASLEGVRILDIGCGVGGWIRELIKWGADPGLIYGIDTIAERIEHARRLSPASVNLTCGNAACLAFPDEFFDLVMLFQSMCLMSDRMRQSVAAQALRVLKPDGAILWYDYRYQRRG